MDIEHLYTVFLKNPRIIIDSRQAAEGCIFVGLPGEHTNGGQFARQAIDAGCAAAIVDNRSYVTSHKCILVEDSLLALTELARYHRKQLHIPVIAVTGSNGKTTTKELIAAVLQTGKKVFATTGNLNNHIGVPLSVLSLTGDHEIAIIEMGANHQGEIAHLCTIAQPTHGIITMVGKAHLEGFGSPEGVLKAKSELYDYLSLHGGTVFVNADDALLVSRLIDFKGEIVSYGTSETEFCFGKLLESQPYMSLSISGLSCQLGGNPSKVALTKLIGHYNFTNALAAACVGMYFGIELQDIIVGLSNYEPRNNRSQLTDTGLNKLILDYYNANPSSMEVAILNFRKMEGTKKMLILGDMLELGPFSKDEHEHINQLAMESGFLQVFTVGAAFMETQDFNGKFGFENTAGLIAHLKSNRPNGYTILIKGSRGMKLEQVVEYL